MAGMMDNKKAWLRIVEAVIAVLIVASVFTFILVRQRQARTGEEIDQLARTLVFQIERNNSLREVVFEDGSDVCEKVGETGCVEIKTIKNGELFEYVEEKIPLYIDFELKICAVDSVCGLEESIDKKTYVNKVIISSSLQEYKPKKLKLFLWEK